MDVIPFLRVNFFLLFKLKAVIARFLFSFFFSSRRESVYSPEVSELIFIESLDMYN